jgi:hypothetical protein
LRVTHGFAHVKFASGREGKLPPLATKQLLRLRFLDDRELLAGAAKGVAEGDGVSNV